MGYSARSVNESQHLVRYSTCWNVSVVFSWRYIFGMEIHWLSLVDLWQTYVLPFVPSSLLMVIRILSRLREKHPLVSHWSALYSKQTYVLSQLRNY